MSSATGEGIDKLISTLDVLAQGIPEKEVGHVFRLPIDRVFSMKGFGTVITGTTVSGRIKLGEDVTIYPSKSLHGYGEYRSITRG